MLLPIPKPDAPYSGDTFAFAGWEFGDHRWTYETSGVAGSHLTSHHILPNPEAPNLIYSYRGYRPDGCGGATREWAAAWLIAHWYEHFFGTCPCLHGDKPSHFKSAFIETLLL